jgi:hypothetical protein
MIMHILLRYCVKIQIQIQLRIRLIMQSKFKAIFSTVEKKF